MGAVLGFIARLVIALWGLLRKAVPTVLVWLGLSFATHEFSTAILLPQVRGLFPQLPNYMLQTIGMLRVDQAFTILLGCLAAKKASSLSLIRRPS
jgi:hypothetical protein